MEDKVLQIPIEDILPNRFQPRLSFDDDSLNELAASIKQHGIIQPLILRRIADKYEIIAGERRYKAAKIAGLISVPAIISKMDDTKSAEVAIIENIQRKDLTSIEEARSFKSLLEKDNITQDELARKLGLSQAAVSNKLRLLTLDSEVQDAILKGKISERHARSMLKIKDSEVQKKLLNRIIDERLTVKQLEEEIKNMNNKNEDIDVPLVDTTPDLHKIVGQATDIGGIKSSEKNVEVDPNNIFSNPEQMPNKFFNFLEDEAANMSMEEKPIEFPTFTTSSHIIESKQEEIKDEENIIKPLEEEEEIELLDFDFPLPIMNNVLNPTQEKIIIEEKEEKIDDSHVDEIIKLIRDLDLNSDKVSVEEINLPNEYLINIKIKKNIDSSKK